MNLLELQANTKTTTNFKGEQIKTGLSSGRKEYYGLTRDVKNGLKLPLPPGIR
jgi:hypothetical protein